MNSSIQFGLVLLLGLAFEYPASGQTVVVERDASEQIGERPYEMVWANRKEPAPPTLRFDQLHGWKLQVEGGAQASLQLSRAQNIWNRPVSRLRYHGDGNKEAKPRIFLILPKPMPLPDDADAVDFWVYGNRWDWENPPDTPPVRLVAHVRDRDHRAWEISVDNVRWQEWWLIHRKLPPLLPRPARLERIEVAGGWQTQPREIYFDSACFYREPLPELHFAERPRRNLTLPEGQSPGANTGLGKLPFPTREQTILPMHFGGPFQNLAVLETNGGFGFIYRGDDALITYHFDPAQGFAGLRAELNHEPVAILMSGAAVGLAGGSSNILLKKAELRQGIVTAEYDDGTSFRLRLWQKSLVLDVIHRTGQATELQFGRMTGVKEPRTLWMPYIVYSGTQPVILLSRAGAQSVFTSLWLDWYRSNGSEPFGADSVGTNSARINGGVRYFPRTDGRRNPLFERLFITVSPRIEEVLPTVPNPLGLHAAQAVDRLWQESWGPENFEKQKKRSRMLRAYGIDKLIQCNHEITWRDGGESFTLRVRAAPKRGGDDTLRRYVAHQLGLDWLAGLYSNYTDFAPVNRFWNPDWVQRTPDGNWRAAWPRCWALKPLKAVELDYLLSPQIKQKYNPNSAYTDVHTAVAPWAYNDFDARVPGAGTFAQTFYAYGELLRHDSQVYAGPIFSEGTYHWLYAGLADGNYALAYNGRPLANEPLLPLFDLYQIHPKECDIGMGWTAFFCDAIPNWRAPENIDRAIDRFLLHTLAYGHIGWLVEEEHGIARTCRSYYMLQAVQAQYGLMAPTRIAYWDGRNLVGVSEAVVQDLPRSRRQLYIEYPGGLNLWFNDHPSQNWPVTLTGAQAETLSLSSPHSALPAPHSAELLLPPAGWAVVQTNGLLLSYSALAGTNKVDYLRCSNYTFLDGRGHWLSTPEAASNGGLAITPLPDNRLQVVRISGEGAFVIRRPCRVSGALTECAVYDVEGKLLARPATQDDGLESRINPVSGAVRYVLSFAQTGAANK